MEDASGQRKRRRPLASDEGESLPRKVVKLDTSKDSENPKLFHINDINQKLAAAALQDAVRSGIPLSALGMLLSPITQGNGQLFVMPADGIPVPVGGHQQPPAEYFDHGLGLLKCWFARHWASPYLDPDSKSWLVEQSGMTGAAVTAWVKAERKVWTPQDAPTAATRSVGLIHASAMSGAKDEDGVEDEEDLRVMIRRARKRVDGPPQAAPSLDPPGAVPLPLSTALHVPSTSSWTSANGDAAPNLASGGLVFDLASGSAISIHSGVQPVASGGRLALPPGVHVSVPPELSSQGVQSLVLGPEGSLFAFDASGIPLGTVPYGLTPEEAVQAAAVAAAAASHAATQASAAAAAAASAPAHYHGLLGLGRLQVGGSHHSSLHLR